VDYSDCALVYTASVAAYVEEASASLRSAREHLPGVIAYLQAPADLLFSPLAAPFDRRLP
jgi:xanthine/uracil/vitamin C permease (AzgA family)